MCYLFFCCRREGKTLHHNATKEIAFIYQAWNAWCIFIGLQEEMGRCLARFKLQWLGSYLNEAIMLFHGALPPLVLTIQRMAFPNMQSENDKWVNLFLAFGKILWQS
jgi:hypothetical protein